MFSNAKNCLSDRSSLFPARSPTFFARSKEFELSGNNQPSSSTCPATIVEKYRVLSDNRYINHSFARSHSPRVAAKAIDRTVFASVRRFPSKTDPNDSRNVARRTVAESSLSRNRVKGLSWLGRGESGAAASPAIKACRRVGSNCRPSVETYQAPPRWNLPRERPQ